MIQFSDLQIAELRRRREYFSGAIAKCRKEVEEIYQGEIIVSDSGIANWSLYYFCSECSVKLDFQRNMPTEHVCPSCGRVYCGEPYDGAWWGIVNDSTAKLVYKMAILWLITEEASYARKSIEILLAYARKYADYEIHGDIPYNGPGRVGAQTLDEANFQRMMAMAYDILQTEMSGAEKEEIRDKLLLPAADFLLAHRTPQLHNHEVIISSAIAVIGILFQREDYIFPALYGKYGLYDQLEKGMLENGMWFEGAFSYHFYALTSFFDYEKFALNTKYSGIRHPNYRKMIEMPVPYWEPEQNFPMLNDANYGHEDQWQALYEFAYCQLGTRAAAFILGNCYQARERDNLDALLYGAEKVEAVDWEQGNILPPVGSSGHTVLRGKEGRYLLFKHDCYGGEHDHYDRLGLSYRAFGRRISADLGTTGYGAELHYDYYKNTGSHNTLMIGEENQAPVNAVLTSCEEKDGVICIEAEADWQKPYQLPDSFTIVQWSEENYQKVKMKRRLIWAEDYFIEIFQATGIPEGKAIDWIMHFNGRRINESGESEPVAGGFVKKPLRHLQQVKCSQPQGNAYLRQYQTEDIITNVFGMINGQMLYDACGPDNPSNTEIAYLLERRYGDRLLAAHVVESWREKPKLEQVYFRQEADTLKIEVLTEGRTRRFAAALDLFL